MAEIEVGEYQTADRRNLYVDSNDNKTYRRVRDSAAIDVLEAIADALGAGTGTPFFQSTTTNSTPGVLQTLISVAVPAGFTRELSRAVVVCRQESEAFVYVDATLVGSFRTGPASPVSVFEWLPRYVANAAAVVKIDFRARTNAPISSVDCHIQAVDKPI